MITLLVATLASAQFLTADAGAQVNVILNVFTICVAVGLAVPVVRNRRKDQTIKDLQDSVTAKDTRIRELRDETAACRQQTRQIEQAAAHKAEEVARWHARYEELQRYTAEEAVQHFEKALTKHSETVAGRHEVLIEQGRRTAETQERIAETLDRVVATLDQVAARLDG